jgi:hypothetical protein
VAEEFAFDEGLGHGGAVQGNEGSTRAVGKGMESAGDQFLAGAGFASDQNGGLRWRHLRNERKNTPHRGRVAGHVAHGSVMAELPLQALRLLPDARMCDGSLQQDAKHAGLNRLLHEPEGSQFMDCGHGGLYIAERGQDNGRDLQILRRQAPQQFKAVHAGHFQIRDENRDRVTQQLLERFLSVGRGVRRKAPASDDACQSVALRLFVIGDEDPRDRRRCRNRHLPSSVPRRRC